MNSARQETAATADRSRAGTPPAKRLSSTLMLTVPPDKYEISPDDTGLQA